MSPNVPRALGDIEPALAALPLFPLPNAVLFPGALLPLHVFEPRYRALVRDALASHRSLAVVLIEDLRRIDALGHPAIASVAGAGVIIDYAELPGGRFNILLRGRARVRLAELPFSPPYRRAAATILPPSAEPAAPAELAAMLSVATSFAALVRARDPTFDLRLPKSASPGQLADLCAHHLVLDARERQAILETKDESPRVRRVTEAIALQRLALAGDAREVN